MAVPAPTVRSFVMDGWPQGGAKMRGGRSVRWAQLSAPTGASTDLVWENITHTEAEELLAQWDDAYGLNGSFSLTPEIIAGLGLELSELIEEPFPGAIWRFDGPPVVESIKAKRCTVRLPLRSRYNLADDLDYPPTASWP